MNRLPLLGKDAASGLSSSVQVELARLSDGSRRGVPHALFAPLHYEPNYAYPLLVWLHGSGDDERQLQRIMPLVSMRNYVAVGPRGNVPFEHRSPVDRSPVDRSPVDRSPVDRSPVDRSTSHHPAGYAWDGSAHFLESAEQHVFDAIDAAAARFHVNPRRIFVGGYECGGTAALRIALRSPGRFAGVLTLNGPFPGDHTPLAQLNTARSVPLLVAQGRDSESYPIDRLCENLRLFHAAGMSVTVRHYPCGDELTSQMLHDIDLWMMEIVTGVPTGPPHPPVLPVDSN